MLEFLSHNCKEKASFFLIVFFNLLILCQKLLIQRYNRKRIHSANDYLSPEEYEHNQKIS
ncbi:hypothetical protein E3220_04925 [Piscirickettsia salmonis EM-90]|nr:hypothetical protein E3220_04925 [Piscirickettsia salmonis EM-90]